MLLLLLIDKIVLPFIVVLPALIATAYFTLAERKVLASVQRRTGPTVTGLWGILQPIADGIKLLTKENLVPSNANKIIWHFSPFASLWCSFLGWYILNPNFNIIISSLNFGVLFSFVISSLNVYWIFLAGWFGRSQYGVLGSLRAISQLLSYELSLSLLILPILLFTGTLNYNFIIFIQGISVWLIFPLLPCGILYFICILAETNRIPFDLLEAEAELVAGYYTEFSGFWFASFFLSEYGNILLMSSIYICIFFGAGNTFFSPNNIFVDFFFYLKVIAIIFAFIFLRANLPRFRFDQLMVIGWKIFLPLILSLLFFYLGIILCFNSCNILQLPFMTTPYINILINTTFF
jgi:NADH:ubiquinone oxidoreductase subunit H